MDDILIFTGDAVKALGDNEVEGYLVRWGNPNEPDLSAMRDWFHAKTYFGARNGEGVDATLNHGIPIDGTQNNPVLYEFDWTRPIGQIKSVRADEYGLIANAIITANEEYRAMVMDLVKNGRLSYSSGAVSHLVKRTPQKNGTNRIDQWIIGEAALTPTPAEPRLGAIGIKSLNDLHNMELESAQTQNSAKATDEDVAKTASSGADAVNVEAQQNNIAEQSANEEKQMDEQEVKTAPQIDKVAELEKQVNELKAKFDAPAVNTGAPAIKKVTELGFKDDATKSFLHWIRTGDDKPYKAAMQGQTDSEGGYAVPDDFYNQIVAKRNEVSIARQMGVQIYPTTLDRVLVPVEDTAATKFVVTAEEGSYDENEPTLNQVAITVHKLTKLIKMSEELEADARGNFGAYIANIWGRTLGLAENYYFFNIAANGSSQPQSATYAATTTTAVASQTAFTAAELLDLIYAMPSAYSEKMALVMRRSVLGKVRSLTGNPFSFIPTPHGSGGPNTSGGLAGYLHDVPVYVTDNLPAQAAANKPVLLLNPDFYMIAEREGLNVQRNPYLYQATGQIGFFARARMGGALLQSEAAYVLVSKT